jgi:hypothetical protein
MALVALLLSAIEVEQVSEESDRDFTGLALRRVTGE